MQFQKNTVNKYPSKGFFPFNNFIASFSRSTDETHKYPILKPQWFQYLFHRHLIF